MCMWNDVKEACSPSQLVYLALDAPPTTLVHRSATSAYDRNLVCNGQPDKEGCLRDRANRCFWWNKSCVGMDAFELVNWLGAGHALNGDAALLDFTCPGTTAMQYKVCRSATDAGPDGICNSLPGCQFVPLMKECVPKEFDAQALAQLQATTKAYNAVEPGLWGACEGACYTRQAYACVQAYNSSTACKAKPYCVWEYDSFDQREVCLHRDTAARGTDAFSKELGAIRDACAKLKSLTACEEPKVRMKQVGKFRRARRPNDAAVVQEAGAVKCVV